MLSKFYKNKYYKNWIKDLNNYWFTKYLLFILETLFYTLLFGIIFILAYKYVVPLIPDGPSIKNLFSNENLTVLTQDSNKVNNIVPELETSILNKDSISQFDYVRWIITLTSLTLIGYIGYSWHQAWVPEWLIQDPDFIFNNQDEIFRDLFDFGDIISSTPDIFAWSSLIKASFNYLSECFTTINNSIASLFPSKNIPTPIVVNEGYGPEWYYKVYEACIIKLDRRYHFNRLEPDMVKYFSDFTLEILFQIKQGKTPQEVIEILGGTRAVADDYVLWAIMSTILEHAD